MPAPVHAGKDTTRTFVAVFPPPPVARAIAAALERVRAPGDGVSWVREGNVHYTLRFLGDLGPGRVAAARRASSAAVRGMAPFELALGATGAFPNERRPRVLWLGATRGGEALTLLARSVAVALEREGFPGEDKPFVPHLTLGRVREAGGRGAGEVGARLAAEAFPHAPFRVEELVLVASTLSPGGSRYVRLATELLVADHSKQ
jgi:2'-5' RNA ligase